MKTIFERRFLGCANFMFHKSVNPVSESITYLYYYVNDKNIKYNFVNIMQSQYELSGFSKTVGLSKTVDNKITSLSRYFKYWIK